MDDLANRIRSASELLAPEAVGDYDDRVRADGGIVRRLEQTAQRRLNAQHIEVVAAHHFPADRPGVFSDPKAHRRVLVRGNACKGSAAARKVQKDRM